MTRHRAIAVVASAPSCCRICGGKEEVRLRGVPDGQWVTTRCPHCRLTGVPYFPLPWRHETAAHVQGPRPDGTWGCACGWIQDKPHAEHVAEMAAKEQEA